MISYLDEQLGLLVEQLKVLGLYENTMIIFSSDNGPTYTGGADTDFFESAGPLRGRKGQLYEGGIRVPLLARWPGTIAPGSRSDHVSAFWDVLPTLCHIAGASAPDDIDGTCFAPALLGRAEEQADADFLYWEFPGYGGQQAVRIGKWKAIRTGLRRADSDTSIQLYDLAQDIGETDNLAGRYPEVVEKCRTVMRSSRSESEHFPFPEIHTRKF